MKSRTFRCWGCTLLAAAIMALLSAGAGCETVKGAGKDIQSVGEAGEDALD